MPERKLWFLIFNLTAATWLRIGLPCHTESKKVHSQLNMPRLKISEIGEFHKNIQFSCFPPRLCNCRYRGGEMASVAAHLVFASVAELVVKLVKPVDSRSPCNSCGQICPQISPNILLQKMHLQYQISQNVFVIQYFLEMHIFPIPKAVEYQNCAQALFF